MGSMKGQIYVYITHYEAKAYMKFELYLQFHEICQTFFC